MPICHLLSFFFFFLLICIIILSVRKHFIPKQVSIIVSSSFTVTDICSKWLHIILFVVCCCCCCCCFVVAFLFGCKLLESFEKSLYHYWMIEYVCIGHFILSITYYYSFQSCLYDYQCFLFCSWFRYSIFRISFSVQTAIFVYCPSLYLNDLMYCTLLYMYICVFIYFCVMHMLHTLVIIILFKNAMWLNFVAAWFTCHNTVINLLMTGFFTMRKNTGLVPRLDQSLIFSTYIRKLRVHGHRVWG